MSTSKQSTISDTTITAKVITPGGLILHIAESDIPVAEVLRAIANGEDHDAASLLARHTGCRCTIERHIQTTADPQPMLKVA